MIRIFSRRAAERAARQAANKGIQPRISRMARIRKDGFPIREIREIRGEKSSRKFVIPTDCSAEKGKQESER
jgi:hypothetical protein